MQCFARYGWAIMSREDLASDSAVNVAWPSAANHIGYAGAAASAARDLASM